MGISQDTYRRAEGLKGREMMEEDVKLLTQTEARNQAADWNQSNDIVELVCIAVPYPFNSWGGEEKGWTTVIAVIPN